MKRHSDPETLKRFVNGDLPAEEARRIGNNQGLFDEAVRISDQVIAIYDEVQDRQLGG